MNESSIFRKTNSTDFHFAIPSTPHFVSYCASSLASKTTGDDDQHTHTHTHLSIVESDPTKLRSELTSIIDRFVAARNHEKRMESRVEIEVARRRFNRGIAGSAREISVPNSDMSEAAQKPVDYTFRRCHLLRRAIATTSLAHTGGTEKENPARPRSLTTSCFDPSLKAARSTQSMDLDLASGSSATSRIQHVLSRRRISGSRQKDDLDGGRPRSGHLATPTGFLARARVFPPLFLLRTFTLLDSSLLCCAFTLTSLFILLLSSNTDG